MSERDAPDPASSMTAFSAVDPALGYLYQARFALFQALQKISEDRTFSVFLETLDDVVFDQQGSPLELLQLKHHRANAANLTDASSDLWKTLRVWIEGRASGAIPDDAQLFLVTTAQVGEGSAASYLRARDQDRDVAAAVSSLLATATTSGNATNSIGYRLFRSLDEAERVALASAILILPGVADITDLDRELRREIWSSTWLLYASDVIGKVRRSEIDDEILSKGLKICRVLISTNGSAWYLAAYPFWRGAAPPLRPRRAQSNSIVWQEQCILNPTAPAEMG